MSHTTYVVSYCRLYRISVPSRNARFHLTFGGRQPFTLSVRVSARPYCVSSTTGFCLQYRLFGRPKEGHRRSSERESIHLAITETLAMRDGGVRKSSAVVWIGCPGGKTLTAEWGVVRPGWNPTCDLSAERNRLVDIG